MLPTALKKWQIPGKPGILQSEGMPRHVKEIIDLLSVFVLHFYAKSVILVDGTIDEGRSSDVTRLFDERFHTASTEAESDFRTRDCGLGRGG